MKKISLIGAGHVGATAAQRIAELELGDIVMFDIIEGMPQGKALDLMEAGPAMGYDVDIIGTNDYEDISDSDVVVISSGVPRKPGMSRDDLLATNAKIITDVCNNVVKYSPDSIVVMVTNPLDIMTYVAMKTTGFETNRVFGMSGLLDASRFSTFIAMEAGCSVRDVHSMVLGGHGDNMIPLPQYATVSGIPISELLPQDSIERLVQRTINGGAEIVGLLKTGSAFYAPSATVARTVEAIVKDSKRVMPVSAYLQGEYGQEDIYQGVPSKLGKNGVEGVIELGLTDTQKDGFERSTRATRESIAKLGL